MIFCHAGSAYLFMRLYSLPLCAMGYIRDLDTGGFQLIADAVGLRIIFGLLCILTRLNFCRDGFVLFAGLGDYRELTGFELLFLELFALLCGFLDEAQAEHTVKVAENGELCRTVGLVLEHVVKRGNGKRGVQIVVKRGAELSFSALTAS